MAILVRRSNLLVPVTDAFMLKHAWRQGADAITLDLEEGVAGVRKAEARGLVKGAIALAGQGAGEVFVRVNKASIQEDLEASVWPGLAGIMLPEVESAAEILRAAEMVAALEVKRGLAMESLCFVALLETCLGVWDIRAIVTAGPRISQVALDERDLARNLGIDPLPEYDPFVYARGRLAVEATAAKVNPVGMAYPLSVQCGDAPDSEIQVLAMRAKNLGMKGVICPRQSWVRPVNAAFTPTAELVAYNRRVREAFAAGVAAGTAAVPLDGRMIDVPVDAWAAAVIALADACATRDAEKQAALSHNQLVATPSPLSRP